MQNRFDPVTSIQVFSANHENSFRDENALNCEKASSMTESLPFTPPNRITNPMEINLNGNFCAFSCLVLLINDCEMTTRVRKNS